MDFYFFWGGFTYTKHPRTFLCRDASLINIVPSVFSYVLLILLFVFLSNADNDINHYGDDQDDQEPDEDTQSQGLRAEVTERALIVLLRFRCHGRRFFGRLRNFRLGLTRYGLGRV